MEKKTDTRSRPSTVFKVGAIALAFLIIGYEAALFIHRAAVLRIEANRDRPDTVYVVDEALARRIVTAESEDKDFRDGGSGHPPKEAGPSGEQPRIIRRDAPHSPIVNRVREQTRRAESFRFNPNTVSVADLQRLGFSEKQALAIDRYRTAGGKFNRKEDFGKSFVVADSVFERLSPFIDIPRLDINLADSAAFDALPGIGPYFAAKMVEHRERLGGYSHPEQLMDIYRFDHDRFDGLSDLITCSDCEPYGLWTLPAEKLAVHPYIKNMRTARAIVLYRENTTEPSVEGLEEAGVISHEDASRLSRCRISPP